ncbi:MBL fold metallo-hydrolase [Paraburkholderia unamae]|uniref:Glyoxylase-like metal-dependent hydrolase (Beta-lactamase superfamily II) n=1 Tax=Paraburkholderia unamae TaxID=219649 RepID=A0ABX5KJ05_9BURK|nr:MBL fold metallo-hydrolase [Paraburkholderia unamae]PVX81218.1 glyoxylase-like metal-dependent hydrolase (beta-lactamase superfamily II) [Paraburkholderia unamae]
MEEAAARSTSGLTHNGRAAAQLEYPFEPPASDGSRVEIAPGIAWIRMPMPIPLDHINVYLLRDDDGWIVVDTGLHTDAAKAIWERVAAEQLEGLPIKAVLCTHFHYDHAGLAGWLVERFDVPLYMTFGEYYMMRMTYQPLPQQPGPAQARFLQRAGVPVETGHAMHEALLRDPFMPKEVPAFTRLHDGQVLHIGARRWRVVVGSGHSPEHACLYCEDEAILISGDQLLPGISSNVQVTPAEPEADPLQNWFDSLDRLATLAPHTLVLPSHQRVFRGVHARVQSLRDHHDGQLEQLTAFIARQPGCTTLEAMEALFRNLRSAMDRFLALGETIAHLSWLRFNGRVTRRLDAEGVYRFDLADAADVARSGGGAVEQTKNMGTRCG